MNLRHAAALSLVGWLLVLPPPGPGGQGNDTSAPLVTWSNFKKVHSSREECERVKSHLINLHPPNPKDPEEQGKLEGEKAGLCVANDDQARVVDGD
jgi:hypothetical protein